MSLATALQCANEIATSLREIHGQGRAHGSLTAANIMMTERGAELRRARSREHNGIERDIRAFGALLFQMLTGSLPPAAGMPVPPRAPGARTGLAGLRASALQIAGNCYAGSSQPTMQQVLTELRLLSVLLKMKDTGDSPASKVIAPFLVAPAHTSDHRAEAEFEPEPEPSVPPESHPLPAPEFQVETAASPVVPLGPASFGQPSEKPQAEVAPRGGPCPKCNSATVYASHPRSGFETYLVRLKVPLCRCHSCYHRYVVFSGVKIAKEMPAEPKSRRRPHRRKR